MITALKVLKDLVGKRLAVQINTTGDWLPRENAGAQGVAITAIKRFNHATDPFLELKNGAADALVMDLPFVAGAADKSQSRAVSDRR